MTFIEFEIEMKFVREKLKKLVAVISEAQRRTLFRFEYNDTTDWTPTACTMYVQVVLIHVDAEETQTQQQLN